MTETPLKLGKKVWASLDGSKDLIGFIVSGPKKSGDEVKFGIQVGDQVYALGYREPADRDSSGKGQTFWLA